MHVCVCMCVCSRGRRHIDGGLATPRADPLSCVTGSQTLSVYTTDPSRHCHPTPPPPHTHYSSWVPKNLLGRRGEPGRRPGGGGGATVSQICPTAADLMGDMSGGQRSRRGEKKSAAVPPQNLNLSSPPPSQSVFNILHLVITAIWKWSHKSDRSHTKNTSLPQRQRVISRATD